jgi:hypothetical protein
MRSIIRNSKLSDRRAGYPVLRDPALRRWMVAQRSARRSAS